MDTSSDAQTSESGGVPSETTPAPEITTVPETTETSEAGTDDGSVDASTIEHVAMVELLNRIPSSAIDSQDPQSFSSQVVLGDIAAVRQIAGLADSSSDDSEDVIDARMGELFVTGLIVEASYDFFANTRQDARAVAAEVGFSAPDIDNFASVFSPQRLDVFGSDLALSPDLVDIGGGVFSAGTGDDFNNDPDQRTELRLDGVPFRFATSDGLVAMSRSTSTVQSWIAADEPTLADNAELNAAAEAMDTIDVLTSTIFTDADFSFPASADGRPAAAISAPFSTLGIGATAIDGDLNNAIVYVFDDETVAADALGDIETAWSTSELVNFADDPTPINQVVDLQTVIQIDNTVLVTVTPTADIQSRDLFDMLYREEALFRHD